MNSRPNQTVNMEPKTPRSSEFPVFSLAARHAPSHRLFLPHRKLALFLRVERYATPRWVIPIAPPSFRNRRSHFVPCCRKNVGVPEPQEELTPAGPPWVARRRPFSHSLTAQPAILLSAQSVRASEPIPQNPMLLDCRTPPEGELNAAKRSNFVQNRRFRPQIAALEP
jgi:hypothetical protein